MKFYAYQPVIRDHNNNVLDVDYKYEPSTLQRVDAMFSWFELDTGEIRGIEGTDGCDDMTSCWPDTKIFMDYLKRREDRFFIRDAGTEKKPLSVTHMLQRAYRIGGELIENSSVLEDRLGELPNTLLLRGYNIEEKEPSDIDEFIKQYNNMDTTIEEFIIEHLDTRKALEFLKLSPEARTTITINDREIVAPKWWFEAYALHNEFIKVPAFRKNIERIVFTYIDKEIDQGKFDLKRALKFISRMGRFNTKVYLVC